MCFPTAVNTTTNEPVTTQYTCEKTSTYTKLSDLGKTCLSVTEAITSSGAQDDPDAQAIEKELEDKGMMVNCRDNKYHLKEE